MWFQCLVRASINYKYCTFCHKLKFHSNLHFELWIFHFGFFEKLMISLFDWINSVGIVWREKIFWCSFIQNYKKLQKRFVIYQRCKLMNLNDFSFIFPEIILKVLLFLIMQSKFISFIVSNKTFYILQTIQCLKWKCCFIHNFYVYWDFCDRGFQSEIRFHSNQPSCGFVTSWNEKKKKRKEKQHLHRNDSKCCHRSSTDWHLISFQFVHFDHNFGLRTEIEEKRS